MSDREKIEAALNEALAGAGGMLAVRSLVRIASRWLAEDTSNDINLRSMILNLKILHTFCRELADEPENWSYKGRFSEALFDRYYVEGKQDTLGVYSDLKNVLGKLDAAYGNRFSVESAQSYLNSVGKTAEMLYTELEGARG